MSVILSPDNGAANIKFQNMIQSYINNFRRYLGSYLKPDIGLRSTSYLYDQGSAMRFEFTDKANADVVKKVSNIEDALNRLNLDLTDANDIPLKKVNFKGTNIILIENKIYIIKEKSNDEWTEKKAKSDIEKIIKF